MVAVKRFDFPLCALDIADAASGIENLLVPDANAEYDRLIEINLDTVGFVAIEILIAATL